MKSIILKLITLIISIVVLLPLLNCIFINESNAAKFNPNPYVEDIKPDVAEGTSNLDQIGRNIIGLIRGVGTIASVVVLIVMGIRYMMGSAEEKAEYKKSMVPYVIGALLVFAITNILAIIVEIAGAIE